MTLLFFILALIVVLSYASYHRASFNTCLGLAVATMIVGTIAGGFGIISWLIFLVIAVPLSVTTVRQQYLVKPLFAAFKKVTPTMSDTEKSAIDAGTTWWEADLFCGRPNWNKLHQYPIPKLSAEEQAFLDGPVEEVCGMFSDWEATHELTDLPEEVWQYLKDNKFFAMIIKKEFGGLEFSAYAQSCVLQKLTSKSTLLSSIVGVPNSLGPGELLQHYGTKEQKDHYLPRLAKGDEIPCFALTSPEAGSDASAIPDFGVVCKGEFNGEEVTGIRLTWNKRYITLAPVATVLGLAFKLRDPDGLLGDEKELGITCALIPTDMEGVKIGRRHFPLNVPFQNGPTQGEDVFVPLDYIIGGPKMAGQGWRMLVECLSVGRAITLPSNSTGGIKSLAVATGAYSRIRRQFRLPIGKMEGVEEAMAKLGGYAYASDAAVSMSTGAVDLGEKPSVISAILKYHLTEQMRESTMHAMDVHGGKGICLGPNNYLGRGYQGAPIAITVEGANILTRNMIIYGQGAIRCHPFVLTELNACSIEDSNEALDVFDNALMGHIGYTISNLVRTKWLALTGARFTSVPYKDETTEFYRDAARFSASLALMSDICMAVFGGSLKRKERISARLGDMLSYLYLVSATLKRYNDEGRRKEDLPLVKWACQEYLYRCQRALADLINNMPSVFLRGVLKVILFPWGRPVRKPTDKQEHVIAQLLQTPNETRERLSQHIFLTDGPHSLLGKQEQTLRNILAVEPLFDKVCRATGKKLPFTQLDKVAQMGLDEGVLSEQEAHQLRDVEQQRLDVINVDDFDPADLLAGKAARRRPNKKASAA
ncbi:acyl-CoA dehydrogenase [Pseudoalteromonas ruthenica]|uniref:Acyl-coenzyme A dehydrogenase n=1 Tax=Pseudoalteromonas ruthenica TaxID=151081 RepID=A0A5S3Z6L3_9GAMM|nr:MULTISPECIES: acyl-CoA dehydrogenase FadE [Pseudoalteromonas]MCF2861245.1 acyl-CoA dehydrogenase FadE [Pseudoalteromonas sp. CNAT2-18]MCG7545150.1 acyl-CoA dehydrogenase FadE [Pseudoalteromonas sp. MM17-2]MCG7557716.1 acyl-CoA dehydrogenase FadE [Pseudoalteromonas sp. CNAT2-18.1]MCG7565313.1 acyl-CoA dehydrogenase FadE [Pseudoalteromonas sp. CnMc7-15]MCG7568386.1 acyl-CoA dehydrogenase FadE [Pseudoalteromonas sp. CNC9-20]|tara:strand:- start:2401 stop:4860 length:2460 start_codon:yes stop_codon:yes gene_type:complete